MPPITPCSSVSSPTISVARSAFASLPARAAASADSGDASASEAIQRASFSMRSAFSW